MKNPMQKSNTTYIKLLFPSIKIVFGKKTKICKAAEESYAKLGKIQGGSRDVKTYSQHRGISHDWG